MEGYVARGPAVHDIINDIRGEVNKVKIFIYRSVDANRVSPGR